MIPTKTYPLSAIMGESTIASCAACGQPMHPIDLVARQQERIAQLEARLKHCEGHAAELEAEVKAWMNKEANVFAQHPEGAKNFNCTIALYTHPQPAQGIVSVPLELTVEMKRAGTLTLKGAADFPEWQQAECVYNSMIAARPK